jgi:hypothetical protein
MSSLLSAIQERLHLGTLTTVATTGSIVTIVLGVVLLGMSRVGDFAFVGMLGFSAVVTGLGLISLGIAGLGITAAIDTMDTRLQRFETPAPPE